MDAPENEPNLHDVNPHCSPDDLALRALGEPSSDAASDVHLSSCLSCQGRLDQLRAVVRTGRATTAEDQLVAPPPTLWEGVARAVREDRGDSAASDATTTPGGAVPITSAGGRRRAEASRKFRGVMLGSVAAAAAVVVALALVVVGPFGSDGDSDVVRADIALAPIAPADSPGVAVMSSTDGTASMTVEVPGLPPADGFYEVWLMDGGTQLVSLGALDGRNRGTFQVPGGLDVAKFRYVDVSLEPFDGNPGHSTDSVVRGTLPA